MIRNQDGDTVTLSSYQGTSAVVLFFYPKAATPGCTAEAAAFKEKYQTFTDSGAVVRVPECTCYHTKLAGTLHHRFGLRRVCLGVRIKG